MSRAEFSKPTRREAIKRSGGLCEATGPLYGHEPGHRCNFPLGYGVQFDHLILEANSHDSSLENCVAVCKVCHRFKTNHHDTPLAAKTLRQQDNNAGIRKRPSRPLAGTRASGLRKRMDGTVERWTS